MTRLRVRQLNVKSVISVGIYFFLYLDENILHNLVAVVVHAYVTGEGLAQENISASGKSQIIKV